MLLCSLKYRESANVAIEFVFAIFTIVILLSSVIEFGVWIKANMDLDTATNAVAEAYSWAGNDNPDKQKDIACGFCPSLDAASLEIHTTDSPVITTSYPFRNSQNKVVGTDYFLSKSVSIVCTYSYKPATSLWEMITGSSEIRVQRQTNCTTEVS